MSIRERLSDLIHQARIRHVGDLGIADAILARFHVTPLPAADGDLDHLIPAGMKCTVTNFPPHTAYVWTAASPSQFWEGKGATREAAITEAAAAARAALGQEAGE